uniref:Sorting nexin 19a n=1 Tax=Sphaeramia orbicularis TaxID=375764 RepID=A0A672Z3X2_9TELE
MALITGLSECLGQRRVLGLGALVAWLVLFHLLVNVWLLCIFTSLLVVLGGWLGSRALLDANSPLHLEHFLPQGKINPPLFSPEHEWTLNHEIHSAAHKAVRDFVSSWYRTLLPEEEGGEFERAVLNSMLESVMELKERARRVDRKELIQRLLELYGCHLQSYMAAKQIQSTQDQSFSLWQIYSEVDAPHPAVTSAAAELNYSKALVNLVLHVLVPYPQMETRTGGYMVTELITCNVLLPLINRVSDPDWLNQTIVEIFTRSRESQEIDISTLPEAKLYRCEFQQESWTTCCSQSSSEPPGITSKSSSNPDDQQSQTTNNEFDSPQSSMVSLTSAGKVESCSADLLTPCKVNCCPLTPSCFSNSLESKMLLMDSLIPSDSEDNLARGFCDCGPPTNFCKGVGLKHDEPFGCFGTLRTLGPKVVVTENSQWPAGIAQDKVPTCPPRKLCLTSYNFDNPNNMAAPVKIQNVQITGTINTKEQRGTGTHPYTLYTVKFETSDSENGATLQPPTSHTVNRRYSEFLNLQTRLEEKSDVKKFIKNVKGPKRIFPDLSFGNPDNDKVESRKNQLDNFLKQLSSIPETANSEDMQEFLALNSDACTYFGRKPVIKSRIDKMMENALDTLKTAFPYPEPLSPTEESEVDAPLYSISFCVCSADTAVADVALNILCLLMKDQWSWLCTENIQKTIRLLFGTFIERWLDVGVAHLTSAPCWVIYLQVMQEAVWPGGTLPAQPHPERSAAQQEETKEQCLECLMQLLPELITDMLGTEKYRLSLETVLESLQDAQINKHLLYCICDLLLELLIPESRDEAFQTSLLQSLSKDTEKDYHHI